MVIHANLAKNEPKHTLTSAQQNPCHRNVSKLEPHLVRKPSANKKLSRNSFDIEDELAALPNAKSNADANPIKSVQVSNEIDDSYVCTDCEPYKFLRNSYLLFEHCQQMIDHGNINPISFYNKFSLKVENIELSHCQNISAKSNQLSRNAMAVIHTSEDWNNFFEVPKKKIKAEFV